MEKMKLLIEKLNLASEAYYQQDKEILSNFEYDKLYDELQALEEETGIVFTNSPTQKVGFEVIGNLQKIEHDSKLLSLDKTKEVAKLESFLADGDGILSWKLDGLTIVLTYKEGELSQAVTRGNGEIGEDVTHNAKVFKNLPLKIRYKGELVIRGEAVISYTDFTMINESLEAEDKYKNPRNLCSGTVRQLNSEIAAKRNVMFYSFSLVKADGIDFADKKSNQINWIEELGFNVAEHELVTAENIEKTVQKFQEKISHNDFASDGLVLTYNSISFSQSLGNTAKFPKDSIAFKWTDEIRETKLLSVEWNTSRTGLINPIAIFEPVELEGTTVNRAALHNISYIKDLQLGLGDTVTVYKANMIIPQIAENISRSANLDIPTECPECKGEAKIISQKEGEALYCTNPNCKAQLVRFLAHYVSRDATNIEGLSESTIDKFVEHKILQNYSDIYKLANYSTKIQNMEGLGEKSYNNLMESIEKSKIISLPNFINALGIAQVGLGNAKLLCRYFEHDLEKIINADFDELESIQGFGGIIADSISTYFSDTKNLELLNEASKHITIKKMEISDAEKKLEGKIFVITGEVTEFKNRKELQAYIEELGGKVTGSVTGKTSYLINNDVASNSAKNKKAKSLDVPIITENTFLEMLHEK